jgi:hypothetical protein
MFWQLIIAAGIAGIAIGFWFRVPALLAASVVVILATGYMEVRFTDIALTVAALQVGYLLGVLVSSVRDRSARNRLMGGVVIWIAIGLLMIALPGCAP